MGGTVRKQRGMETSCWEVTQGDGWGGVWRDKGKRKRKEKSQAPAFSAYRIQLSAPLRKESRRPLEAARRRGRRLCKELYSTLITFDSSRDQEDATLLCLLSCPPKLLGPRILYARENTGFGSALSLMTHHRVDRASAWTISPDPNPI